MKIRSRYEVYEPSEGFVTVGESVTVQSFKDECDINNIVASMQDGNVMSSSQTGATSMPQFGDFSGMPDLQDTYNFLIHAKADFDTLPIAVRERFNYDPARFLDFVSDPANLKEMVSMGLATMHDDSPKSTGGEPSPDPVPASAD